MMQEQRHLDQRDSPNGKQIWLKRRHQRHWPTHVLNFTHLKLHCLAFYFIARINAEIE